MSGQGSGGNVIAAICNIFIPGLGQLVQGRILPAILFFVFFAACAATWFLVIPGIIAAILYVWCIIDAARFKA
jgi:TM2 domain-containing membrane protein YozV